LSTVSLAPQTAVLGLHCPEAHTSSRWLKFGLSETKTYVAANHLPFGSRNRTKESIDTVCHRHLDSDIGESDLNSLPVSGTAPTATAVLSTSPGKYPILCRVAGSTLTRRESTLKLRTIVLGSYLDCTGCNRILHLQELPNCEYDRAYPFTVEHPCDSIWNPDRRRSDFLATKSMLRLAQSHCERVSASALIPNSIWGVDSARACPVNRAAER
jgi:hypothetical protein